ncbi:alpha-L-arabinofuranosidase C-terminal domain-containing protein [Actinoplanes teichomyceticus]|uniref:non-reducing end alpha-L-arabinofuranosidase n=1 Tax=Actinoplanes teichomyceticus TaxID=1867 RepID=A0A561WAD3_ACTTI|nr:alpha-L-arabinofuranosidase C-terminal domain-containing protein [Actinoplanes teichomyceticus]TWG20818.1 alpha-L-arabinofuranosidase [Actinoplanes teichomyceticus]GIF14475.1 alpha-N-arabinofuranosidase [Actinoplanes teichomyceticus]
MPRIRTRLAGAAALLVSLPLAVAPPVSAAAAEPDYSIRVSPDATGPALSKQQYGVFFEDINYAADGGLYAELVRNRSFEFTATDAAGFTGLTAWTPTGAATVVNDDQRLNERNRNYLKLTGPAAVTNAGYDTGIAVRDGATYDFSVWARTDAAGGAPLTVTLRTSDGAALAAPLRLTAKSDTWTRYTGTLRATGTSDRARLTVDSRGAGTLRLDEISLFPRDTYKGRRNGLRKDLAEKIEALHPGFVRFPGGCLVNTGSMYPYDAANGYPRARSYQWKDTVGPVETRATNKNFWGYNQSYGLGYYEYFQFSEDIGAMPLPVLPALVTGCGQNRATNDPALLRQHIQDALDLIEFANGPVTSTWGRLRADMGHPKPFGLTTVAVGNEENLPEEYWANFLQFESAIKAKHPDITVVSNSGPDDQGGTFENLWAKNRSHGSDMVDEHYYNSPAWFLQNNARYDTYDRNGPKVFLGEYASLDAKFSNSLAEAAYMTGLERNADVVKMASYAPLLANIDNVQWKPDMIWFDNDESWGSTSYQVQKLFMNNVGDRVVPSTVSGGGVVRPRPITGAVGLSTWRTAATYDDVKVTRPDGTVLFSDDFNDGDADGWTAVQPRGTWTATGGGYAQTDTASEDTMVKAATITDTDYDYTLKATKQAGAEGFLVAFGVQETGNFYWWNLGGWNNTQGAVEKGVTSAKEQLLTKPNTVETGRTYDLKVQVRGTRVTLLLDGVEWGSFDDNAVTEPFAQVVTTDTKTGELIVKVVNAQDKPAVTRIDLGGRKVATTAKMTVLAGDPGEQNTRTAEPIQPVTSTVRGVSADFTREFPANSVTFLRIRTR